jgi:diguanylate cyclase (GGDEF)-like protein
VDLQRELIVSRDQLHHLAMHDSLTGVHNRRAIEDILVRELARSERSRRSIAVALADVDNFKVINDTAGHQAGDEVLREVAVRMTSGLRPYDMVGRFGGEEFLLVLPDSDRQSALALGERLIRAVSSLPVDTNRGPLGVTISVGVCGAGHGAPAPAETLIGCADRALYSAKKNGKNRVEIFAWIER